MEESLDEIKRKAGHGDPWHMQRGLELILMDYRAMEGITQSDLGLRKIALVAVRKDLKWDQKHPGDQLEITAVEVEDG